MIDSIDGIRTTEAKASEIAVALTEHQVTQAIAIVEKTMQNDGRRIDPALLGAVIVALATNMHGLTIGRKT